MPEKTPHRKPVLSYANRVKVEVDSQRRWIELHFNDYSTPLLTLKLQALGFRTRKFSVMFRADYSRERLDYGNVLEQGIADNPDGPDLNIEPSFQALRTNIEKKEFSLVKISLTDNQVKSYILFEPSKHRAELIATIFAQKSFGDAVQTIAVFPGTRLREATLLFDEGKIIQSAQDPDTLSNNAVTPMQNPNPKKAFEIRDEYYNSISGNNLDSLTYSDIKKKDFDLWIDDRYPVLPPEAKEEVWKYHLARVSAEKTVERLSKKRPVQPYTSIYNKLLKVIPDLLHHLQVGTEKGKSQLNSPGMMDLSYDFLYKEAEGSFIIALAHRFEQNGDLVDDPDMEIRVMPDRKIAEAMTIQDQFGFKRVYFEKDGKKYVYPKIKKDLNAFLNQWLSNIIEQGHRIVLAENEEVHEEVKEEVSDDSLSVFKQAYSLFRQVVPKLPHNNKEEIIGTPRTQEIDLEVIIGPGDSAISKVNITQYNADRRKIEVQYDGMIYYDKEEIDMSFELLDNYYQSRYDRDESEEEIDARGADVGEVITGAFVKFLEDLIEKKVTIDLTMEKEGAMSSVPDLDRADAVVPEYDAKKFFENIGYGKILPNIIIPKGAKEPFISVGFHGVDVKAVINRDFMHLRALKDNNLHKATALELFYLLQSCHPTDIGLKPSRMSVLAECERRGAPFLEELGYPVNMDYPYVNQHVRYLSVEPLKQLLGEKGDDWWAAVENYYPLADPEKGLPILADLKTKLIAERDVYINPKTGKPIKAKLDLFRSLDFDVRRIDDNVAVINHYLQNQSQLGQKEDTHTAGKIAVMAIHLTVNEDTPKPLLSETEITNSWMRADAFVRSKIGRYSNVHYRVVWKDKYTIKGVMDIEPPDFFNGKTNLLGNHILTFYTNISKTVPGSDPIYGDKKLIEESGNMIRRYQFADEENATDHSESATIEHQGSSSVIKGFENAYWTEEDNAYSANKITIDGIAYNNGNLISALLDRLNALPFSAQLQIANDMGNVFKPRHSLAYYEEHHITPDKTGKKRHMSIIRTYLHEMMVDSDIWKKKNSKQGAIAHLMSILTAGEDILMDMPVNVKRTEPTFLKEDLTAHELNLSIEHFIDEKDRQSEGFSETDKTFIGRYTGAGGLSAKGVEGRGTLYEYYTPDEIVQKMWGLAFKFGYTNGLMLEPSCGTGNFLKYVPADAIVDAYETNHYAKRIAEVLYPYGTIRIYEKPFESIFFAGNVHLKDKFANPGYALIIGNPPYGEFTGKYAGMGEKKWTGAQFYEHYFMLRGLDLLLPGGLMVLIIPSGFLMNADKYKLVKQKIAEQAELLDAYRLPSGIFKTTDVGTDIIVLKKKT